MKVRFRHEDTETYLMTHDRKYSNPIHGQQEVCAKKKKDALTVWLAGEGIYFTEPSQPAHDEL